MSQGENWRDPLRSKGTTQVPKTMGSKAQALVARAEALGLTLERSPQLWVRGWKMGKRCYQTLDLVADALDKMEAEDERA
jgi:exonuclease VII small subunit